MKCKCKNPNRKEKVFVFTKRNAVFRVRRVYCVNCDKLIVWESI